MANKVSIQSLVERLRQMDEATFDQVEPLRAFLEQNPVDTKFLPPYLTWDRQH